MIRSGAILAPTALAMLTACAAPVPSHRVSAQPTAHRPAVHTARPAGKPGPSLAADTVELPPARPAPVAEPASARDAGTNVPFSGFRPMRGQSNTSGI